MNNQNNINNDKLMNNLISYENIFPTPELDPNYTNFDFQDTTPWFNLNEFNSLGLNLNSNFDQSNFDLNNNTNDFLNIDYFNFTSTLKYNN